MVVRSPCQKSYPADAHTSNRLAIGTYRLAIGTYCLAIGTYRLALGTCRLAIGTYRLAIGTYHLAGQQHAQQPVSGTANPRVVEQDKSSTGSVDTTKTRSDPQRVRMCKGERPISATKGKQPNTEALCQPPPAPPPPF